MDERLCWINLIFVPIRGSQKSGSGKQQDIVRHRRQIRPDARIPVSQHVPVEQLMQRQKRNRQHKTQHTGKQTQAHSFPSFCFCVFHRLCRILWNLLPVLRFPQNQFVQRNTEQLAEPNHVVQIRFGCSQQMDWRDTCSRSASSCWDRCACRRNACNLAPSSFIQHPPLVSICSLVYSL